jgi:hypothetical protein
MKERIGLICETIKELLNSRKRGEGERKDWNGREGRKR